MFNLDVLVPLTIFISLAWVIDRVIDRRSLHGERLKMIEKGGNVNDLNLNSELKKSSRFYALKYGFVAIGISIGVLLGSVMEQNKMMAQPETGYFFSIFLFVGIALVLSHYVVKNEMKKR